jgi:hypothetical protein
MHKRSNQSGSAHLIIITIISLVILGGLGFIFWQKFTAQPQVIQVTPAQVSTTPSSLIDYGKDGVAINAKSPTDINKLKGAPTDFVAFIKHDVYEVNRSDAPADCSYSDTVTKIDKQTFATGFSGGCGMGSNVIWAKVSGKWMNVAGTQVENFTCSDLEKYAVPSVIAGTTCNITAADGSISGTKSYSQN